MLKIVVVEIDNLVSANRSLSFKAYWLSSWV